MPILFRNGGFVNSRAQATSLAPEAGTSSQDPSSSQEEARDPPLSDDMLARKPLALKNRTVQCYIRI